MSNNSNRSSLDQTQIIQRVFDSDTDRLRVDAEVTATLGTVECIISAVSGDNIAIISSTGKELVINSDGSISTNSKDASNITNVYSESNNVVNGVTTNIVDITLGAKNRLSRVEVAGTNAAQFEVLIDNAVVAKRYTAIGISFNEVFDFKEGLNLNSGQNIKIAAVHNRPYNGDFNANIILKT